MSVSKKFLKYFLEFTLALISLLCILASAQADTYYVAEYGNDNYLGTEAKPWLTVNKAADTMVAGDTVYVKKGTYSGFAVHTVGTSFDNMVSYLAYHGDTPIIDGQIYFSAGASYNKIDGFKNIGSESIDIEASNADHNIISNCILVGDGNGNGGGIGYSGTGNIFEGNEIRYGGHGLHPGGTDPPVGTLIKNNIIHDLQGHGIAAVGGKDEKAIGNIVYNCKKSNSGGGTGIFFATQSPENVLVKGNLVWGSESNEIAVEGTNCTIVNNTAVGTDPNLDKVYNLMGSGFIVKNNIGYRVGVGKRVLLISQSAITDYNCWFNPDELSCISRNYDIMTFEQYQASGQGAHSISQDPKFANLAGNDFHLQPDSPCIGAGENGVDMGAYGAAVDIPSHDPGHDEQGEEVRNRPNPFCAGKEETLIEYDLEQPSNVTITIYDLLGQEVWRKSYEAGENGGSKDNSVPWDGRNLSGEVVANGGYICRIWVERENRHMVRKIAVAK